jgi:membrane protein involved in colicin uptake
MPMGSHRNNKSLMIGVIIGAAILVGGMVIALVVVLTRDQAPQVIEQTIIAQPAAPATPSAADEAQAEEAKKAAEAALAAAQKEEEPKQDDKAEDDSEAAQAAKTSKTAAATTQTTRPAAAARQETSPTPAAAPARTETASSAPARKTGGGGGGGIDDIIGQIDGRSSGSTKTSGSSAPAPTAAASNLPASLTREMVQSTVRRHNAQIAQCSSSSNSGNLSGTVQVRFTVEPNGSVSAAAVQSPEFRGTDVGSCIEGVVRGMNFPATSGESRSINYPFILR